MTEPLDDARGELLASYLEMMRAHVDEGGRLSHRNGIDLLAEVERLRAAPARCDAESAGLRQLFSDHYWDSFEADKEIILKHIDSVLALVPPPSEAGRVLPKELHWLGDRENADATRHAPDMTGCVAYFEQQSDCLQFMRWLTALSSDPGTVLNQGTSEAPQQRSGHPVDEDAALDDLMAARPTYVSRFARLAASEALEEIEDEKDHHEASYYLGRWFDAALRYGSAAGLTNNRTGEASAEEDIVNIKSNDPGTVAVAEIARDLAECIGRYMSETDYRSRLLPSAAEFVANRALSTDPGTVAVASGDLVNQMSQELTRANALNKSLRDARLLLEANGYTVASADRCADPKNCPYPVCIADGHCESSPISSTHHSTPTKGD